MSKQCPKCGRWYDFAFAPPPKEGETFTIGCNHEPVENPSYTEWYNRQSKEMQEKIGPLPKNLNEAIEKDA